MKALLVQCPATSPWVPRRQWEPPSVALATIAAQIDNHDVKVLDLAPARKRAIPILMETLQRERPGVVGFSGMAFQYDCNLRMAYLTKQFDPHIKTVLGGYHAGFRKYCCFYCIAANAMSHPSVVVEFPRARARLGWRQRGSNCAFCC